MGRTTNDYQIRVPESAEPGACLEITKCLKISAAPETPRGAKEQSWCFVNGQWLIYSESEPPPPTQTITLQGAEDVLLARGVAEELLQLGCPFPIQAVVDCGQGEFEEVLTFPGVSLNSKTPDNGYGFGVPGVDTGAAPPSTVTLEGTWFGSAVTSRILTRGIAVETADPNVPDAVLNKLFFCDLPTCGVTGCGSATPSNGCRIAYGIYDDGTNTIIAKYHISSTNAVDFIESETLPAVNGFVDGCCVNGKLLISDGTCLYTSCGAGGLTKVVLPDDVPDGSIQGVACAVTGGVDHYYALFSTSGVIGSTNGRTWEVVLDDLFFPAISQQTGIVAVGDVVATFGADAEGQHNNFGGGGSWTNFTIDTAGATDPILDLAMDIPNPFNQRYALMYAVTDTGTALEVHFSNDDGAGWELRRTFAVIPDNPESVTIAACAAASRVYLSYDSTVWVNFSFACDCDWSDISPDFTCGATQMAVCHFDCNAVFMVSDGQCDGFARNNVAETISSTPGQDVVIDVLANDRASSGETLDPGSNFALFAGIPAGADGVLFNPGTGELTVQVTDGFTGLITFDYVVDDTTPVTLQATVKLLVGDVDPSLLVC